ncbi:sensor protein torS [Vibrio variabilis]|uniref:Sensor protein torS n=1 Tax=Vibrio variabilis TaxID=990271 RepID=A0ABQ0JBR9_9VIBR|nr:sensor protein torS [Vibrio variabilis]
MGVERVRKIVNAFVESSETTIKDLEIAAQTDDEAMIKSLAHKLKGSAAALGLSQLFEVCLAIETADDILDAF